MFDEFQNGTNTVMNIKCDFVGCENQDSVFCATREQANNTLFERGWVIDSRKWKHFCKDHAAQHRLHLTAFGVRLAWLFFGFILLLAMVLVIIGVR